MLSDAPQDDRESSSAVQIMTAPQLLIKQATMKRVIYVLNVEYMLLAETLMEETDASE